MQIKKITEIDKKKWNEFCNNNSNTWVYHRASSIINRNNHSFCILDEDRVLAICPLFLEKKTFDNKVFNTFSLFGLSIPFPVISDKVTGLKQIKKINNIIHNNIIQLSKDNKVSKVTFNSSSFIYNQFPLTDLLNSFNYYGYSVNVNNKMLLLNLTKSIDDQWANLSKGHRSIIKKYVQDFELESISKNNSILNYESFCLRIREIVDDLKDNEFLFLFDLYKIGLIDFLYIKQNSEVSGGGVFLNYGNKVEYFASKRFIDNKLPIHHLLIWLSIEKYTNMGFKLMNLGIFSYSSHLNYILSDKKKNISLFKRGFGVDIKSYPIIEKFFNKEFFSKELNKNEMNFKETII